MPEPIRGRDARDEAAAAVGVSGRTVDFGTKVLKHGVPELVAAVDKGEIAMTLTEYMSPDRFPLTTQAGLKPRQQSAAEALAAVGAAIGAGLAESRWESCAGPSR